jgi:hypothetical protein
MRRRCCNCKKMTEKWQRLNGGPWHCYDGCMSTTGIDFRKTIYATGANPTRHRHPTQKTETRE